MVKECKAVACSNEYQSKIDAAIKEIQELQANPGVSISPEEMEAREKKLRDLGDRVSGLLIGLHIQHSLDSEAAKQAEHQLLKSWPHRLERKGQEAVCIITVTGLKVWIQARYFTRKGKRSGKKRYRGFYLGLMWLGIDERCTPGFASEVSVLSAMCGSLAEAKNVLADQGIALDTKVLRRITYRFAERARLAQQLQGHGFEASVAGRRVVVSLDGGRIRLREKKRGPKTKKGRNRYHGAWREPKLFIVYLVDAEGKMERSFMPVLDALIRAPDTLFKLLAGYLEQLRLVEADQVLFVADGARWIWNRISLLMQKLGLKSGQVHELIDFYHAVEHLGKVAALRKSWTATQRKSWIRKHRRLLLKGEVEQVIDAVKAICRGRNGKGIRTERDYFLRNIARMAYDQVRSLNLPIGSGSVESAIRRVVNLRLKGPCVFWCKENAEAILLLRCYWKAGRWNQLKQQANSLIPDAYA